MHILSFRYRVFSVANYLFMTALSLISIIPIVHILAVSLSNKAAADGNIVKLWPVNFTWEAYMLTFENGNFLHSIGVSVLRTGLGVGFSLLVVVIVSYVLAQEKEDFPARNMWAWFFVITMLFNGGLVPTYVVIQKLGLVNHFAVLILPMVVNVWSIILMLNFFRTSVPKSLVEAARIDGAGHLRSLWSVYLPISVPALATIGLFTMVSFWNEWFQALIYMTKPSQYPMSTLLQTIVVQQDFSRISPDPSLLEAVSNRTLKAAQIFIAMIPVIAVYPFLQSYFVKGIVLGSVKE